MAMFMACCSDRHTHKTLTNGYPPSVHSFMWLARKFDTELVSTLIAEIHRRGETVAML
jgi:hypothetical protein